MANNKGHPRELTERQKMFCREYLIDLNATQAAIRAGYSAKTAGRIGGENLKKLEIQKEIQKVMNKRAEKVEINADDVLKSILDIRDTCTQKLAITNKLGEELGESMVDTTGALKANELLGKHLKLFTDKVETEVKGEMNINFNIPRPKK